MKSRTANGSFGSPPDEPRHHPERPHLGEERASIGRSGTSLVSHEQKWKGRAIFCPTPPICRLSLAGEAQYIDPSSFRVGDAVQIGFLFHLDHHGFADIADLEAATRANAVLEKGDLAVC